MGVEVFFLLSRGKMDFYSCFVAQQTSSLKVRDSSAADSPRYLLRRPLAARSERGGGEKEKKISLGETTVATLTSCPLV